MSASENPGVRLNADRADARDSGQVADSSTRSTTDQTVGDRAQPSWARWKDDLDARYTQPPPRSRAPRCSPRTVSWLLATGWVPGSSTRLPGHWSRCEKRSKRCWPSVGRMPPRSGVPGRWIGCRGWRPLPMPTVSVRMPPEAAVSKIWWHGSAGGFSRRASSPYRQDKPRERIRTPTERSGTCAAGSHTQAPPS